MQIVSSGDNLHAVSSPISLKIKKKYFKMLRLSCTTDSSVLQIHVKVVKPGVEACVCHVDLVSIGTNSSTIFVSLVTLDSLHSQTGQNLSQSVFVS